MLQPFSWHLYCIRYGEQTRVEDVHRLLGKYYGILIETFVSTDMGILWVLEPILQPLPTPSDPKGQIPSNW